jgi:hypothetical protein
MSARMLWGRWKEKALTFIVWHWLPYRVRYWVVIRAFADASRSMSDKHPDDLGYSDVMRGMSGHPKKMPK